MLPKWIEFQTLRAAFVVFSFCARMYDELPIKAGFQAEEITSTQVGSFVQNSSKRKGLGR
jgi:hypothetical protein